jgi:tRNA dimethylallyltransferase
VVVCGPTAAGKSALADSLAENLSAAFGAWATTIVVDSMQVYREIPVITNQDRARPAELVGIVSVGEEWTVARHKERSEEIVESLCAEIPFVLDAGTGMYLNAIVLDIPLAPKVRPELRAEAAQLATGAGNPRREARKLELTLAGAHERGSIWDGPLRYDATFVYLRPPREELDRNILLRSQNIVRDGAEEAKHLQGSGVVPNPSVLESIGVKEMILHTSGDMSAEGARQAVAARTRRLARRQIRWFDKLVRSIPDEAAVFVVENPYHPELKHLMHDIIGE